MIYNWQNDAAQGLDISSSRMQGQDADIASGLSNCITKDGQQTATANLPMGGFRHTNVANAQYPTEYATVSQVQSAGLTLLGGSAGSATFPSLEISTSSGLTLSTISGGNTAPIKFGDGTGWKLPFQIATGANAGNTFATISDLGSLSLDGNASLNSTGSTSPSLILNANGYSPSMRSNSGNATIQFLNSAGSLVTLSIDNTGNVVANGVVSGSNITGSSDERLKEDWRPMARDFLERMAGVLHGTFSWKKDRIRSAGVGAASLREVFPEAVHEDAEGMLSVAYGHAALVTVLELIPCVLRLLEEHGETP
ncbi:tail fiber domain-containing protein [Trinickia sp. NRRL B-1857]|uniref:tail fiber domain-containing protein n=1 Tax=Trinickia sp. NRRL B-1857 TaxID=3162879 RepID=UPI003D2933C0